MMHACLDGFNWDHIYQIGAGCLRAVDQVTSKAPSCTIKSSTDVKYLQYIKKPHQISQDSAPFVYVVICQRKFLSGAPMHHSNRCRIRQPPSPAQPPRPHISHRRTQNHSRPARRGVDGKAHPHQCRRGRPSHSQTDAQSFSLHVTSLYT